MLAENNTIRLPALMEDCPEYWQRFAEPFDDWPDMQAVLESEYRARPVCVPDVDSEHFLDGLVIEFDTAQDLTWFLLKWS